MEWRLWLEEKLKTYNVLSGNSREKQERSGRDPKSKQRFMKAEVSQRLDELLSMEVTKFDEKTETKS